MADTTVIAGTDPLAGMTIGGMGQTAAHAKPARRDILLWAVAVIAGFALYDIWGAWAEVGDKSGFAHGTGWTLTVIVEVFGVCALCAWLAPAGPRSRRFAMWSAVIVFVLSLAGQASSHLTARTQIPPAAVVVFVSVLPVIVLALIAVLVHLRHLDRAAAAEAVAVTAAAQELTALRADLLAQREALSAAQSERDAAQRDAAEAAAEAAVTERRLAAALAASAAAKRARKTPQKQTAKAPSTKVPRDVDVQAQALAIIAAEPGIMGKDLGPRVGRSERWGQDFKNNLAITAPKGQDPEESP